MISQPNPQASPKPPNGRKRIRVGRKTLIFIWVFFIAYLVTILYFFNKYTSTSTNDGQTSIENSLILEENEADSLLAQFFNAFEAGNFEEARKISDLLNEKYPDSDHARRASELIATIEKSDTTRVAINSSPKNAPPPSTVKPKKQPKKTTVKRTQKVVSRSTKTQGQYDVIENERRLRNALEKMRTVRDDQRGITWYYNKNLSHYVYKNSFEIYIGQNDDGDVWLRMRIYYSGKEQLNIDVYEINVDDRDYTISTLYGNMQRGDGSAGAWEWYDAQVASKELRMIEKMSAPGPTEIRYLGKSGTFKRMMTEPEKLRLKYVLTAYRALLKQQNYLSGLTELDN